MVILLLFALIFASRHKKQDDTDITEDTGKYIEYQAVFKTKRRISLFISAVPICHNGIQRPGKCRYSPFIYKVNLSFALLLQQIYSFNLSLTIFTSLFEQLSPLLPFCLLYDPGSWKA